MDEDQEEKRAGGSRETLGELEVGVFPKYWTQSRLREGLIKIVIDCSIVH